LLLHAVMEANINNSRAFCKTGAEVLNLLNMNEVCILSECFIDNV